MNQNKEQQSKSRSFSGSAQAKRSSRYQFDLSGYMLFCVIEAAVLLILLTAFFTFFDATGKENSVTFVSIAVPVFYVLSAGTVCLTSFMRSKKIKKAQLDSMQVETEIYDMFRYVIDLPYALIDGEGQVKIMNGALQDILGYKKAISGIDLSEFCSVSIKAVIDTARNREAFTDSSTYEFPRRPSHSENTVTRLSDGRRYEAISYIFRMKGENYYFLMFRDIENLLTLREKEERETGVIAYIFLDNLQELTQYVRADYRAASAEVENILRSWVSEMNGFIREYENDKYIALFTKQELDKQITNDFEVSRRIMELQVGDNSFPITISMGISAVGKTFAEKEKTAFDALSIAIRRGGNQIAVCREHSNEYSFFGGTHKIIENNTAVLSRVSGQILEQKIRNASSVLIMGHSNPDFDSIGSCVGMARFALSVIEDEYKDTAKASRPPVNIVVDKSAATFEICQTQLAPLKLYNDIFIGKDAARDLVTAESVLIICDVNNPYIYESPELTKTVRSIALLDHHRLAAALPYEPFLQYVETTKSSASEIVSEILLRSRFGNLLHKEEAEILLSGIMLDTNNFTRNAGQQTFEITHYLYSRGAHTGVVREFFNQSLDELLMTGEFESKARIYRDCIAITWMTGEEGPFENRIVAAKVADNLLRVKGVQASFALVRLGNDVVISGRSKGSINVQLILERLRGGGHFDIAGAQVQGASLTRACELLKDAIDDYFEYDYKQQGEEK